MFRHQVQWLTLQPAVHQIWVSLFLNLFLLDNIRSKCGSPQLGWIYELWSDIKVPITKKFLFSYLKLYLIKITSAKKFCDLNKSRFFNNFLKTFKLAAILHTIRLSLLSEYDVIWRTLRNIWLYRRKTLKTSGRFLFVKVHFIPCKRSKCQKGALQRDVAMCLTLKRE